LIGQQLPSLQGVLLTNSVLFQSKKKRNHQEQFQGFGPMGVQALGNW